MSEVKEVYQVVDGRTVATELDTATLEAVKREIEARIAEWQSEKQSYFVSGVVKGLEKAIEEIERLK